MLNVYGSSQLHLKCSDPEGQESVTSISFLQHSKAGFETGKERIILQRNCKSKVDEENVNVTLAEIKLGQFKLVSAVFKKVPE